MELKDMSHDNAGSTRAAIKYFNKNKGTLHANSKRYKDAISLISGADSPMTEAKRFTKLFNISEYRSLENVVRSIYQDHIGTEPEGHKVNTQTLHALINYIKAGFPKGQLDPQHLRLIDSYEATIFAGKADLPSLIRLAKTLTKLAVCDFRTGRWSEYSNR